MQVHGQIISISTRDVATKNGTRRAVDVSLSNGITYGTLLPELGSKAQALSGQHVVLEAEQNSRGFWNFSAIDLEPVQTAQNFSQPPNIPSAPKPAEGLTAAQKDERIMRGNALNATCALLGSLVASGYFHKPDGVIDSERLCASVVGVASAFVNYLGTGAAPAEAAPAPEVVQIGAPTQTNKIPF